MKLTRKLQWKLALLASFAFPSMTNANPTTLDGNFYYHLCNSPIAADRTACQGYSSGWADAMGAAQIIKGSKPFFCVPTGVVYEQIKDVFTAFLNSHPEKRQMSPSNLMAMAMSEAFPCK